MHTPTDPGETRPATLVVLLALVLIVGVTIGILVNALVVLDVQNDDDVAASTATPTISSVEGHVYAQANESSETGDDALEGDPKITELRLEIQLPSDAEPVDLTELEVHLDRPTGEVRLTHVGTHVENGDLDPEQHIDGTAVATDIYFVQPKAVETVDSTMVGGDRYEIVIPVGVFVDSDGTIHTGVHATDDGSTARAIDDGADVETDVVSTLNSDEGVDNTGSGSLTAGDEATITLFTGDGGDASIDLTVPQLLENERAGTVPLN